VKGHAIIIGSGIGGLGSACLLAKAGWDVTVLEKNDQLGGRAGTFEVHKNKDGKWSERPEAVIGEEMQGDSEHRSEAVQSSTVSEKRSDNAADSAKNSFRFDMGPSWYLMPDVFEHFFELLGEDVNKHLELKKLSPGYRVFYKDTFLKADIYSDLEKDRATIEQLETGAADNLKHYLAQASHQYLIAKDRFMYKNYDSIKDFLTLEMLREGRKLKVFKTMDKHVRKYFKTDAMQKLVQYPLVFLGSSPYNTPALYNIMSHIDFNMGVYYPMGGVYKLVEALQAIGEKNGVKFQVGSSVSKILVQNGKTNGVSLENGQELKADIVISNADIHHTETHMLEPQYQTKSERYWESRTMAPSAFIMYLGVKGKIPELTHHNLLFSKDWKQNFSEIFDRPRWPKDPSLYVCKPSETDLSVAPEGSENLFVLVPIAAGLKYDEALLEHYADKILKTLEEHMHVRDLAKRIIYKRTFCVKDFETSYNSYKGSALGLAHTLKQTAVLRPNNINPKVSGLYYVGAGTNPGIGMPITLISAELMYKRLINDKSPGPLKPEIFSK
jgi:phytoene desaturase